MVASSFIQLLNEPPQTGIDPHTIHFPAPLARLHRRRYPPR
jgi:hypothetical protein